MAGFAIAERASQVDSRAEEVGERIADLSEMIAAARRTLADLGDDDRPSAELRRINLQATIKTLQRELVVARQSLQNARGIDAATEILANVKAQAREAWLAAHFAQPRAKRARHRAIASQAVEAILSSANTRTRKPKF